MAEDINVASYRLVALTYKGGGVDLFGTVKTSRVAIIYSDAPNFRMASFRLTSLVARTRNPDLGGAVKAARVGMIYMDAPTFRVASYRLTSLVARTRNPDFNALVKTARIGFIIRPPAGYIKTARIGFIINQVEVGPPARVPQVREQVIQTHPEKPLSQVISYERAKQVMQLDTIASDPMPFPWSYTRVPQMRELVLQAKPNVVQSYDMSKQVRALAVGRFNYTIPGDIWSREFVSQNVMLVLQSLDIPYTPTSGEFIHQNMMLVVQASDPLPIWRSPAYIRQYIMLATTKRPVERLPRSNVYAALVRSQAVTKRPVEQMPYSLTRVAEVRSQAVQATQMPEPVGVIHSKQVFNLAVAPTTMDVKQGMIYDRQLRAAVVQARVEAPPISRERVPQVRSLVAGRSTYPLPGTMTRLEARQVRVTALQQAVYPPPDIKSYEMVPQLRVLFSTKPPASEYPDPAIVYDRSKKIFLPQFTEQVTQARPLTLPISRTKVPQLQILAAQHTAYPTPEEMATSGIFVLQAIEHAAVVADYPSTDVPASNVDVTQLTEQLVVVADYPDAHLPTNYAIIPQLSEQVAMVETYPDPGDYKSPNAVWQLTEQLTYESAYPDAGTLHSPVLALQLAQAVSLTANYPDKDSPQSYARVSQLSQQAAFTATYPNKDAPQSIARVNQVFQHVARRDLTMYQLPVPPRRHRVRIVCRFVY